MNALKEWPQTMLGAIVLHATAARKIGSIRDREIYAFKKGNSGVSLGKYIFVCEGASNNTIQHEYGHCIQSERYGWLYLLIVGLPSVTRNIWNRIAHKSWPPEKRSAWYYSAWPEKQADKLGEVERNFKV